MMYQDVREEEARTPPAQQDVNFQGNCEAGRRAEFSLMCRTGDGLTGKDITACLPACLSLCSAPPLSSSVLSSFVRSCCVGRDTIFKGGDISETCLIYSYETVILFQGQASYILSRMIIVLTMREYLKHTGAI